MSLFKDKKKGLFKDRDEVIQRVASRGASTKDLIISVFLIMPCNVVCKTADQIVILDWLLNHLPPLSSHCYYSSEGIQSINLKTELQQTTQRMNN